MQKKFYIIIILISIVFTIFIYRVYYLNHDKGNYYLNKYNELTNIHVLGSSAPRGRILDINGKVLVDNIGVNSVYYYKPANITIEEELSIAKKLVELTNYKYKYNKAILKDFYMLIYNNEVDKLITKEERRLYQERKINKDELTKLKKDRITQNMINNLTELEKYSSYFYYLMNEGYSYDNKIILRDISDELYAIILEENLPGIFGEIEWRRIYPYDSTLKSIFGLVSNTLPSEKKELLSKGYTLKDKVGISGLEEYYEEYLKGEKAIYKLDNNKLKKVKEAKRGKDIVLEIDIDIQLKVEEIIKEQIINAKTLPNTKYYRESYALVSNPKTSGIIAVAGIRRLDNGKFQDVSINVIKNAYTVGSVVKAASHTVGYQNNAIDIGTTLTDSCVKLANLPAKCSFKKLGKLNDLRALAMSSNYYQFITALKVAGYNYTYNMKAEASLNDFNKYRTTFKEYGLGTLTHIDLPGETTGVEGSTIAIDLLLNLSIGQYDLYTPVNILQYINTLANNGTRLKLNLMHSINYNNEILYENETKVLNKVNIEQKYLNRIQKGLKEVLKSGTGYGYIDPSFEGAGKTGTSESYIDSNYDGVMDANVLSNTFAMYAPFENPLYSLVVISPNVSDLDSTSDFRAPINRLIARNISDYLLLKD